MTAVEILESGKAYSDDELRKLLSGFRLAKKGYSASADWGRIFPAKQANRLFSGRASYNSRLWKKAPGDPDTDAYRLAAQAAKDYPALQIHNCHKQLCAQRTIKKPCEIDAMRQAEAITAEGILAASFTAARTLSACSMPV